MKKSRDNYTFLTHAPVHRVIFAMAIPTIISMLSTSMYNLADTYFVGSINTQSVAAVGVSFAMMAVIQAVGFFYGHGAGNYISRMLGAKEVEKAKKMAATGFILSFLTGLFIAFLGQLFLTPLCVLLGSTPTIQPYTERYLGIILLGRSFHDDLSDTQQPDAFPGQHDVCDEGNHVRSATQPHPSPTAHPLFCHGHHGCRHCHPHQPVLRLRHAFLDVTQGSEHPNPSAQLHANQGLLQGDYLWRHASLSRQGLGSIATLVLNVAAGAYGDAAIAGMSIVTRISFFTYAVVIGLGQGFQPLCGFCYGAKLYGRVKEAFFFCIKCGTVFLAVCAVFGFLFSEPIIELFRDDASVVAVGSVA